MHDIEGALVPVSPAAEPGFTVTVQQRLYHTDLLDAARKVGGQKALADMLHLSSATVGHWIRLRHMPDLRASKGRLRRLWPHIEKTLYELTGKTTDELFPGFVRLSGIFERPTKVEAVREISVSNWKALANQRKAPALELDTIDQVELKSKIEQALKTLPARYQQILVLRYGLRDGKSLTYEEIGKIINLTAQRVRDVEAVAIRKLQIKRNADLFEAFAPKGDD